MMLDNVSKCAGSLQVANSNRLTIGASVLSGASMMNQTKAELGFDPDTEYRAIEAALLETARGRWFLAEHGRRARRLDGNALEEAIEKLSSTLRQPPALLGTLKREVEGILSDIEAARSANFAKLPADGLGGDGPSNTQNILKAAEDLHELAWNLQADETNVGNCEAIARHVARIYAMSRLQSAESERAHQFGKALSGLASRLSALLQSITYEMLSDEPRAQHDSAAHPLTGTR